MSDRIPNAHRVELFSDQKKCFNKIERTQLFLADSDPLPKEKKRKPNPTVPTFSPFYGPIPYQNSIYIRGSERPDHEREP